MTAPDRNKIKVQSSLSTTTIKRVSVEVDCDTLEQALAEWLPRHLAEFRNMELQFQWNSGLLPSVIVTAKRETSR